MPAYCQSTGPADESAYALAMELALTMSDEDIHSIASWLLLDGVNQNDNENVDYLLAACLLDGFIHLRAALKLIGEGKLRAVK